MQPQAAQISSPATFSIKDLVRVELAKLDTSAGSPDQLLEKYQANFTGASKPQGWSLMRCATESEAINP